MLRHEWVDPVRTQIRLGDYAARWIAQRPGLGRRTVHLYTWLLGKHVSPYLGSVPLGKLDTAMIREWRSGLLARGVSSGMVAKAYRLLRAVLMTAVREDEILRSNPCRIPGADQETATERPVLTLSQVFALADQMPPRYSAMVLLATFACLRWGEVAGLERQDVDLEAGTVRVRQAYVEVRGQGLCWVSRTPELACGWCRFRRRFFRRFGFTWRRTSALRGRRWCSRRRPAGRSGGATSTRWWAGERPWLRSVSRVCTFMISGTPATRWRLGPVPVCARPDGPDGS
jgi:integrase